MGPHSEMTSASTASAPGRFYPLIDARCSHKDHDQDGRVYRAVGDCGNCHNGPYLLLLTFGHDMPYQELCPRCGCYRVRAARLAEDDELPVDVPKVPNADAPREQPS